MVNGLVDGGWSSSGKARSKLMQRIVKSAILCKNKTMFMDVKIKLRFQSKPNPPHFFAETSVNTFLHRSDRVSRALFPLMAYYSCEILQDGCFKKSQTQMESGFCLS